MVARFYKLLVFLIFIAVAALGAGYYIVTSWAQEPVTLSGPTSVEIPKGSSLRVIAQALASQGIIDDPFLFQTWVRLKGTFPRFQAGTYRFDASISPTDVAASIISGDIYEPIVIQYTIPEGFTLNQVIDRLVANGIGPRSELEVLARDPAFLTSHNISAPTLEGFIYPATYSYVKKVTPKQALTHMVETFWKKLPRNYEKDVNALGLTLNEAITFASLIECETNYDDEKSLISEVIWARLKDKVPLAIDASIIYGIADYDGDLRWKHLGDAKNPYNTRIHKGLPPGPIGAPSQSSMAAVLNPTDNGYYFYVLKPDSDRHYFSKTLKEHNRNVRKLINAQKRR